MSSASACQPLPADRFFEASVEEVDPEVAAAINGELGRQRDQIELIASENIVSRAVLEAAASVLTNKYAEGYPHRRYYGGCEFADDVETLAIDRARRLFGCAFANVQPHSGTQANQAAFMAMMRPGDTFLGLALDAGGHLTHGAKPNQSGKWFHAVQYGVRRDDGQIDLDEVRRLGEEHKPSVVVAGGSAYPRVFDFAGLRRVCDEIGARLMVDMAHFAGLVAGGAHPSPFPHADVVTATTHKTLRGPRGGMVLTNDEALAKKINAAIFPGMQGGPLMHIIAAKAVALGEALRPDFRNYAADVVTNARVLAETLLARGLELVSGGTDTHLVLVDLRKQDLTGRAVEEALERAHLTVNKNAVPFDPEKPTITSGIRLGSAATTTRGFAAPEFRTVATVIADVIDALVASPEGDPTAEAAARQTALGLCRRFPIYGALDGPKV